MPQTECLSRLSQSAPDALHCPTDSPSLLVAVCSLFLSLSPSAFFFSSLWQM
ncbi:uncharacterized protein DS421_3g92890 [Arachis hypogaea]|nr:uncharacterized protein DS421_3g92890 [Arachis hypogaea]